MKKKLSIVLLALATCMSMSAQNLVKGDYGYLYCHMSDKGEWTAYAVSRDGYNYQDINDGKPIFNPEEHARIEGGTRDAYITRMHNGKGYIMVITDMCVRKSRMWQASLEPMLSHSMWLLITMAILLQQPSVSKKMLVLISTS